MTTPIYDFLQNYIKSDMTRFHMPGHKGNDVYANPLSEIYKYDITEITGADELFCADGIIAQSEENTALLYGAKHTCFSAGGSTACIQAMIRLVTNQGDTIIAARNVHTAFINACGLLDVNPVFVIPEFNDEFCVSGAVTKAQIEQAICENKTAKAVYITSPDYLGCISDVRGISQVCNNYNIPLVVDNAHGAHLKFMPKDVHPITLGATMCCDSAHKTLPVLTGGAYIHVNKNSSFTKEQVKSAMSLFASTSPSYLILQSLDLNNRYLQTKGKDDFRKLNDTLNEILVITKEKGFTTISKEFDITKLTLNANQVGMTGGQLKSYLKQYNIEPEYVATKHVVLMISPQNTKKDIERLKAALKKLPELKPIISEDLKYDFPARVTSIRQAMMSPKKLISIDYAVGEIAGESSIKCPPGVPIILAGEKIDKKTQKLLKKSSIFETNVLE